MQLDLRTAITLIMWLALGFTVVAMAIRWARRTHPGYRRWAIAGLLLVLSLFLLSLRSAPVWIKTLSANTGIALASILYLEGAREFRGLAPRSWFAYLGGVAAIGAVAVFSYIVPNMNARAAVMSAFLGVVLTLVSIRLLRGIPPAHRFGQAFTGSMFALCAATLLARAFYCYVGPPMNDRNALSGVYGTFFIATVVEMAAFSLGLTLLADERVMSHLNEARDRVSSAGVEVAKLIEAQALLRESEERFRRVFEEGPLGLALVGTDHRFLKVNSALCQMLDYSEAELVQKTFAEITHPDDVRADVELTERLFASKIPFYRLQKRYLKKNGESIWVNLTKSLILDDSGAPLYGLNMIEDVTELKRTHEEAFARQKLESVGTLASGIAHDFNNILGGVEAQAELALAELDAGSSCKEELKAICEAAKRGSEIVRELMIYAGKESGVVEWIDLSKIVEEMLALLKVSVSKHAIMDAELSQNLPATRASAAQLRQIAMNLITNASDAIGERDGVIRVATRRLSLGADSATVSESLSGGDYVVLEVSDTGCGMSRETQDRVFDPFFTTKSVGRGLGLAVVSGIVRGLGGTIRIASELGRGSSFQILLPCAEATGGASVRSMSTIEEPASPSRQAAILVVEDEGPLRQAVAKMLRKNGFDVFEAADGSFAIDLLRANGSKIDAILLDMTLPGATGQEVLAEAVNVRPDIRVVLTSAYGQEMFSGATNGPQVSSFIRKPFQLADLMKALRHCLVS